MTADSSLDAYRGVRAAVLGGSGFIGRWVARRLSQEGADVALVVRSAAAGRAILSGLARPAAVIVADLAARGTIDELFREVCPDISFNLVGYGVDHGEREEALYRAVNAELPDRLAAGIARLPPSSWKGQRLVHTGSALEYGESRGDLAETSPPVPTTIYGRTKLAGTRSLVRWRRERSLRAVTARLFTVYGEGEHPGRLLPSLIAAADGSGPIALTEGWQKRDFTYVEDVAEGLLRLGVSRATAEVVNLATGRLTAVRDFVCAAARVLGIPSGRLAFGSLPTRTEEMQHLPVNVAKLRTICGWVPEIDIAEGVRRTLACLE